MEWQFEPVRTWKRVWLTEPSGFGRKALDLQSLQQLEARPKLNLTVERNQGTVKQGDTVLGVRFERPDSDAGWSWDEITGFGAGFHAARSGSMVARSAGYCRDCK